jgi:nickel-type superoxide dismutase maturation protease
MLLGISLDSIKDYIHVEIIGDSMSPTLNNGETRIFQTVENIELVTGDIVLAKHPFKRKINIVKRITKVSKSGSFFLEGDNPCLNESSDSRSFGYVKKKDIIAKSKDAL